MAAHGQPTGLGRTPAAILHRCSGRQGQLCSSHQFPVAPKLPCNDACRDSVLDVFFTVSTNVEHVSTVVTSTRVSQIRCICNPNWNTDSSTDLASTCNIRFEALACEQLLVRGTLTQDHRHGKQVMNLACMSIPSVCCGASCKL